MPIPRKYLVNNESAVFYHCLSRCVRRAYLCGEDTETGRNYNHQKVWLEKRMLELTDCFAVSLYAYAVMDQFFAPAKSAYRPSMDTTTTTIKF